MLDKIKEDLKKAITEFTIEDFNIYTMNELYMQVANKTNEVIEIVKLLQDYLDDQIFNDVENIEIKQQILENVFNQLIINAGNSNAEIVDARVQADGTTHNKLRDRLNKVDSQIKEIINKTYAQSYGVKGDGGNYTNELNNAILSSNGGCVILPEGTFYIDEILNIKEGTILEGAGKTKTVIKKSTTGTLLSFNNPYSTYHKDIEFRNLTLDGTNNADIGLDIYSTSHVNLTNVKVINFKKGIVYDDVTQPLFVNCTIRDNSDVGIVLGRQSDSVNIISCDFLNNGNYGLIIGEKTNGTTTSTPSAKSDGVNIIGSAFTKNNIGVLIKGSQTTGVNIKGSYFERNTTNHIQISESGGSTVYSCEVDNSFFNGGNITQVAIKTYNISNISIRYNSFINHLTGGVELVSNTNCKYIRNEIIGGNYAIKLPNGDTYSSGNKELVIGKDFYDRTDYVNHGLIIPNGGNSNKPTANKDMKGFIFLNKKNTDENDILEICIEKSDGSYVWQAYQPIQAGNTSQRPTVSQWGYQYFDTSLSKPIWWKGKWVDSNGNEV